MAKKISFLDDIKRMVKTLNKNEKNEFFQFLKTNEIPVKQSFYISTEINSNMFMNINLNEKMTEKLIQLGIIKSGNLKSLELSLKTTTTF